MKLKPQLDEYIKKEEVNNIYNYQKKVFDSKIEDLQKSINKIEDCFSLRFGENISNSTYQQEIEEIRKKIEDLNKCINNKQEVETEIAKLSYKLKLEIEEFSNNEKSKLEELNETTTASINELLENTKQNEAKIKFETEKYISDIKLELDNIAKDGRSRTAIGRQEKAIKEMQLNKKEIDQQIQNINNILQEKIEQLTENLNFKIQNLNYEETITNISKNLREIQNENFNFYNELVNKIEDNKIQNENTIIDKINALQIDEYIKEASENFGELKQSLLDGQESYENKVQLSQNELRKEILENQNSQKEEIKKEIANCIQNLNYEETISNINKYIEEVQQKNKEESNKILKIIDDKYKKNREECNNILSIIEEKERKNEENITAKINGLKLQELVAEINNNSNKLKDNLLKRQESYEENLKIFERNLKSEILENQYTSNQEIINNIIEMENKFNQKIEEQNYEETIELVDNISEKVEYIDNQMQAVLNIVANLEDRYSNIQTFDDVQEIQIEQIINKKVKEIEYKYSKILENKIKYLENNLKAQQKVIYNKLELKQFSNENTEKNNSIRYINNNTNNTKTTIYKNIPADISEAAETIYNKDLMNMIDTLKSIPSKEKIEYNLKNGKNQILRFNKSEEN